MSRYTHAPVGRPGLRVLARDPLVYTIDDFVSADERAAVLAEAGPLLEPPRVSRATLDHDPEVRTGRLAWLAWDHAPAATALGRRVAALVGLPLETAESLQVVRYEPGERYLAHFDAYDLHTETGRQCASLHGQRLVTALLYLMEPDAGGATAFPRLGLSVEALPGRLLIFEDLGADPLVPHPDSLHAGTPVHEGTKWIASQWFCRPLAQLALPG